ncbi:MAG: hypothetical protein K0V04_40645, partial [Deltaproteobacteria bacterium]|nr:hypothetical protein [Deltaproteobacteria bacterium]
MRRLLAAALLVVLPSVASAGARQDITDLRHGRTSTRQQFHGWTASGHAVAQSLVCSEGGELSCFASIEQSIVGTTDRATMLWQSTDTLYVDPDSTDPKGPVSMAEAKAFIRTEAETLDGLGPLEPGTPIATPREAFGTIGGESTRVYIRSTPHPVFEDSMRLYIAVQGPRGASVDLERLSNEPWTIDHERVVDANLSPDGSTVWVAMHYTDGVMCWDGEDLQFAVADRAQVRAKLANAAGLRAYREGELSEAYDRFVDATSEDPSLVWGWYNRGAVESRRGDTAAAADSLGRALALDPKKRERA